MEEKVHSKTCPGSQVWNYITRNDNQICQVLSDRSSRGRGMMTNHKPKNIEIL